MSRTFQRQNYWGWLKSHLERAGYRRVTVSLIGYQRGHEARFQGVAMNITGLLQRVTVCLHHNALVAAPEGGRRWAQVGIQAVDRAHCPTRLVLRSLDQPVRVIRHLRCLAPTVILVQNHCLN